MSENEKPEWKASEPNWNPAVNIQSYLPFNSINPLMKIF